jgi:hypothetical protein
MRTGSTLILLLVHVVGYCQFGSGYIPVKYYSKNPADRESVELIKAIREQTTSELKNIDSKKKYAVEKIYKSRLALLVGLIERKGLIQDDSLEQFVQQVFDRIVDNNNIEPRPGKVLIIRETSVNAMCYGEGTTLVTLGLLSKIVNEGQLAFALAHEIAHYDLEHVKSNILKSVNAENDAKAKSTFNDLAIGEITEEKLAELKDWIYSLGEFNRAKELQADSLGFLYYTNAGYPKKEVGSLLKVLESANNPKYKWGDKFFDPLDFTRYPFQKSWLKSRLSIYSRQTFTSFVVPLDSLKSHPEFRIRKAALSIKDDSLAIGYEQHVLLHGTVADFELVESSFNTYNYDRCLYYALQLKPLFPKNVYLNTIIGKILSIIAEGKMKGLPIDSYVSNYIENYSPELKLVNSFLFNISGQELAEVSFNFLNHQDNFNRDNEESYFLLWKMCDLTERDTVKEKVKESYAIKFPKGKLLNQMK